MSHLLSRLFSCVRVSVDAEKAESFLDFFLNNRINSWGYNKADNFFSFFIEPRALSVITEEAGRLGAAVHEVRHNGLFPFLLQNRRRWGLLLGALLSVILLYLSSLVVWDVRISGNENMTVAEVREELSAAGLDVGTHMASFDRMQFSTDLLTKSEKLSFVGVNFHGTVAYVQIMERNTPSKEEDPVGGANLVASADAVIESLAVSRGDPVVARGDVVRAGDLLVSGITEGAGGSRVVYAKGEIFGRVEHRFEVIVPRTRPEIVGREEKTVGISLNFFGKSINIYRDTGNLPTEYVTIYKEIPMMARGGRRLPFSICAEYAVVDQYEEIRFSDADTVRYAEKLMQEKLSSAMMGKELLQKSMRGAFSEDVYVLVCYVTALENIARVSEFSVSGNP